MLMGRKTKTSHIKGVPEQIELDRGNGDKATLVQSSVVQGVCKKCGGIMYVESHLGVMCCCHCRAPIEDIAWTWGQVKTAFLPEGPIEKR